MEATTNPNHNKNIDTSLLDDSEVEEAGQEGKQILIDQKGTPQDYIELGGIKIASVKLDASELAGIVITILKDKNIKALLKLNTEKDKSYCS